MSIKQFICRLIGHRLRIRFREDLPYQNQYYVSMCKRCRALLELKLNYDMLYGDLYLSIEKVLRR